MDPRHRAGSKAGRIDRRVVAVVGAVAIVAIVAALDPAGPPGLPRQRPGLVPRAGQHRRGLDAAPHRGDDRVRQGRRELHGDQPAPDRLHDVAVLAGRRRGRGARPDRERRSARRSSRGACLVLIFLMGLWQDSMETLVQVLIATIITFALGLAIGIGSARSDRFATFLRPILDTMQTMPSFVYILPAFVLFDASRFTAIVAAIVFAVPAGHPARRRRPSLGLADDQGGGGLVGRQQPAATDEGRAARRASGPPARAQPGGHPRAVDGRRRRPRGRAGARLRRRRGLLAEPPVRDGAGRRDRAGPARDHARPDDPWRIRDDRVRTAAEPPCATGRAGRRGSR